MTHSEFSDLMRDPSVLMLIGEVTFIIVIAALLLWDKIR